MTVMTAKEIFEEVLTAQPHKALNKALYHSRSTTFSIEHTLVFSVNCPNLCLGLLFQWYTFILLQVETRVS
jgi:hypothetical protein